MPGEKNYVSVPVNGALEFFIHVEIGLLAGLSQWMIVQQRRVAEDDIPLGSFFVKVVLQPAKLSAV